MSQHVDRLVMIMAQLRDPDSGCPWDIAQTFRTIAPYTLEEAHEVVDAIERGDLDELRGELGDLLLQVIFHARMAQEQGAFTLEDVAEGICDKMIRRHPHVFGENSHVLDSQALHAAWEQTKAVQSWIRPVCIVIGMPSKTRWGTYCSAQSILHGTWKLMQKPLCAEPRKSSRRVSGKWRRWQPNVS